ncbi:MAG TPA: hypothetical protein VLD58_15000 [Gemmatimonadales bacterium]|nr:hypothetical protein [Gemmatimonadales bacterium]
MSFLRTLALVGLIGFAVSEPATLAAQSSMFGVRGLGFPGRPLTPRSRATGGAFGLFDPESEVNPAAIATQTAVTAGFVLASGRRHWEAPAGTASLRETRFPLIYVGGPVPGSRLGLGISIGSYADRDFRLASADTINIRGQDVGVNDTLSSLGGLNEIRLATGIMLGKKTGIGGGFHFITGSSRLDARRHFSDTTFTPLRQTAELSYHGIGFSLGITHQLTSGVKLAAMVRSDTRAKVDLDSTRAYTIDLPFTFSGGAQIQASRRLSVALAGTYRTWSGANSDLLAQGAPGARNTLELNAGGEFIRNVRRPSRLPIRLGVRYADIPFPVQQGGKPKEFSISAGTGTRFAAERGGIDFTLEQAWRSEGSSYKERAFTFMFGLSIRPYGEARR